MRHLELREKEAELKQKELTIQSEMKQKELTLQIEMRQKELELRELEMDRQRRKGEAEQKRKESLAGQTKFYGDALKYSLPKMSGDVCEYPSYFQAVENIFAMYEVPRYLQSTLLIPMLNERCKSLLARLPNEHLGDYKEVHDYLLREFKLTPEQYRDQFWTATKTTNETYTLFGTRVKNLFSYYLESRTAASKDDVIDLLVSDRIKQTLPASCLDHVLSTEGTE